MSSDVDDLGAGHGSRSGKVRTVVTAESWEANLDEATLSVSTDAITVVLPLDSDVVEAVLDAVMGENNRSRLADNYEHPDDEYDDGDDVDEYDGDDDPVTTEERTARISGWRAFNNYWAVLPADTKRYAPLVLLAIIVLAVLYTVL